MSILIDLLASVIALLIIAAAFVTLFDRGRGIEMFKRLGLAALGLLFGLAVIEQLAFELAGSGGLPMLLLFAVASVTAYFIREARKPKPRDGTSRRGEERTPLMPHHFNDDGE